jgi:hypothetical protein
MKPVDVLFAMDADIAQDEARLELKRSLRAQLAQCYGEGDDEEQDPVRRKARKGPRVAALRVPKTRRQPLAAGSLNDRIVQALSDFQAPMGSQQLCAEVKALPADVKKARKELIDVGRIVMVGQRAGAKYSVPKFANVIVATE